MHRAIQKIKHKFGDDRREMLKAMYKIRDTIHEEIKSCANNVKVYIYVNDVLEEPLHFTVGSMENELVISVQDDGTITYKWTSYTKVKSFWDFWEGIKNFVCNILRCIRDRFPTILTGAALKAIELI